MGLQARDDARTQGHSEMKRKRRSNGLTENTGPGDLASQKPPIEIPCRSPTSLFAGLTCSGPQIRNVAMPVVAECGVVGLCSDIGISTVLQFV
jgi:hypothetical protein